MKHPKSIGMMVAAMLSIVVVAVWAVNRDKGGGATGAGPRTGAGGSVTLDELIAKLPPGYGKKADDRNDTQLRSEARDAAHERWVQANAAGKTITVVLEVGEIFPGRDMLLLMSGQSIAQTDVTGTAEFPASASSALMTYKRGDTVKVRGEIVTIDFNEIVGHMTATVQLRNCAIAR